MEFSRPEYWSGSFPGSSVGKESACNAGDPSLIPGSGRSPEEGIGYPLHYSRASLVAQLVKNPPTMWETWVQSLGWEDPLEKGKATTPVFWPGKFLGVTKSRTRLSDFHFHYGRGQHNIVKQFSSNKIKKSLQWVTASHLLLLLLRNKVTRVTSTYDITEVTFFEFQTWDLIVTRLAPSR